MNFDNLCVIFSFLDYEDLTKCRKVCKVFRDVADRDEYWRILYDKHWGIYEEESLSEDRTWHDFFIEKHKNFGRYISIYKRIKQCWNDIEKVFKLYHQDATSLLRNGVSDEELDEYEREIGVPLPLEYRCSMRIRDGEMPRRLDVTDCKPPILGVVQYYHVNRNEWMLPLNWNADLSSQFPVFPEKTFRSGVIPLSMSKRNHLSPAFRTLQLLSVDERKSGLPVGTVFYWVVKPHCDPIYHYHVTDDTPFEMYVENALNEDLSQNHHKMASSYMQWLEQISQKHVLNAQASGDRIFDLNYTGYYFRPDWVLTTSHVTVRVGIRFIPEESAMNWFWTYRVIFEMADDAPVSSSCVLQRRHWVITDAQGRTDVVDGEGVIGEYPKLTPGTVWCYSSCTHLNTESGTMGGYFVFRNLRNGVKFNVTCPEFNLKKVPL